MVLCSLMRSVARAAGNRVSAQRCRRAFYSTEYKNRYYTKKHEWVSVNEDIGTVGISSFAQEALGEVVFAALPEPGAALSAGDECGALESVKAAGEIYAPVSGTVTESNASVEASPSLINASCYSSGWLFRVRISRPEELRHLMDQVAYDEYLKHH